jgi:hypothetical protein
MFQKGLDLGSEHELLAPPAVIQGLDPQTVARQEELPALRIPDRERKHPDQAIHHPGPELFIEMHQRLRVALRFETVAPALQLVAQFPVVIDFAVEGHPDRPIFVGQGLAAARHVDDAQPDMAESRLRVAVDSFSIRAAMAHDIQHALDDAPVGRSGHQIHHASNSTHRRSSLT